MRRIRVLIVDDSTIIRRLITDALQVDPELEVIGTAANGKIALSKIDQLNPDVITMDIEMPEMNGIEAVTALRKKYPRLPVIMFSTLTSRGAEATLDALSAGANDYVTKPSNVGSLNAGLQAVRDQLIPKLKALCEIPVAVTQPATPSSLPSPSHPSPIHISRAPARPHTIEVVVIGVSTGGPNALAAVLPQIPANFHLPIVIVQHMPPLFTRFLAERLNNQCPLSHFRSSVR